jgi:hypothetical protein
MSISAPRRFRLCTRLPGLLLAMLALAGQIAFGGLVPPVDAAESPLAGLDSLGVICHAASEGNPGESPAPHRHSPDCAICPLCVAMTAPAAALLSPGPMLPAPPTDTVTAESPRPPARAPPSAPPRAAQPRGPPVLT